MERPYDPNFPDNLDIKPSSESSVLGNELGASGSEYGDGHPEAFGKSAQVASIRKYGIAGRIWCGRSFSSCNLAH
jgi:hypothetical protein